MPLNKGAKAGSKGFKENVKTEVEAGKPTKQAVAIAYKESGEDELPNIEASKRVPDVNNWFEVKDNPLSKVGVFPYSGAQIGDPSLDPNKIYMVYRPEEELSDPETVNSFRLLPWIDDHEMLGSSSEGLTPAETKTVHGVIGDEVKFDFPYLKGNLKVFSEKLADLIQSGKKELSIGYRCLYQLANGVYDGVKYDAIQRQIRGNHLALVDEGRAGPDVAVLDHNHTFRCALDGRQFQMTKATGVTLDALDAAVKALTATVDKLAKTFDEKLACGPDNVTEQNGPTIDEMDPVLDEDEKKDMKDKKSMDEDEDKKSMDADEEEMKKKEAKDGDYSKKDGDYSKDKKAMDAKIFGLEKKLEALTKSVPDVKSLRREAAKCDELAQRLSHHIGTFDHAEKSHLEVVRYGLDKLGLKAESGAEVAMLEGFLAATERQSTYATDSKGTTKSNGKISAYLAGAH